jgi:hypothetical protein
MKRRAGSMFLKIFIRSFLMIAVLLITGVISYKTALHYWQPKSEEATRTAYQVDTTPDGIVKEDKEGISKNLIYCYEEDTEKITKLILEMFDSEDNKMTYITIPEKTQLTLSNNLYQKLILDDPEIPQILKLTTITEYLDHDRAFSDELLIVEELLGTDINYYTAVPKDTYDTIFKEKYIEQSDKYDAVAMEIFTGDYKKLLKTLKTEDKLKAYIEEIYPKIYTNLPLEDKLSFLDSYFATGLSDITFKLLPGENLNSAYIIDPESTKQQLEEFSGID